MQQFAAVTEARPFLLATLRSVIDGGDVTNDELDAALPRQPVCVVLNGRRGTAYPTGPMTTTFVQKTSLCAITKATACRPAVRIGNRDGLKSPNCGRSPVRCKQPTNAPHPANAEAAQTTDSFGACSWGCIGRGLPYGLPPSVVAVGNVRLPYRRTSWHGPFVWGSFRGSSRRDADFWAALPTQSDVALASANHQLSPFERRQRAYRVRNMTDHYREEKRPGGKRPIYRR